jgi:hypothetical protein
MKSALIGEVFSLKKLKNAYQLIVFFGKSNPFEFTNKYRVAAQLLGKVAMWLCHNPRDRPRCFRSYP